MKTVKNTISVNFYLNKSKINKDGKSPIVARVTLNRKRIQISTGRVIEDARWNGLKGVAKGSKEDIVRLNNFLSKFHSRISEAFERLNAQNKLISLEDLKLVIEGKFNGTWTIRKMIEYHNESQTELLVWGTMKNYLTTQKYLLMFIKKRYGYEDYKLSDLNYQFLMDFNIFLRKLKNKREIPTLSNNGVMKHLERVGKMVKLAVKLEWIDKYPFAAHQKKMDRVDRAFLTQDELYKLEKKYFNIGRLRLVKDLFLFSCYTGISYIDAINLKTAELVTGIDGSTWIISTRRKTAVPIKVPLLPVAAAIVEKYKNSNESRITGNVLPGISNQKLNSYLKEMADLCGIEKKITYHTARHTFATTVTLTNGVPIETVSRMLGHSKISTTQIYSRVVESKIATDMNDLKSVLSKGNVVPFKLKIVGKDQVNNPEESFEGAEELFEFDTPKRKAKRIESPILKLHSKEQED